MHIETRTQRVVQLLIKGDHYETLCPKNEDEWYTATDALNNPLICKLIEAGTLENLKNGRIDYIVCRGNW